MANRPALTTESDMARAIRAVEKAGKGGMAVKIDREGCIWFLPLSAVSLKNLADPERDIEI